MGLDMFLNARRHYWGHDEEQVKEAEAIRAAADIGSEYLVESVSIELMYWRKANAIHNWFVKNVQNGVDECQRSDVSLEDLQELQAVLNTVLEANNIETAHAILPTTSGFFFGPTDYDEWYWGEVKRTKEFLDKFIPELETKYKLWYVTYQASW